MEKFREFLQQDFIRRKNRNKSFSLRAYAKHIGINHATLSGLISGRRPLTPESVQKIALRLNLSPDEIAGFTGRDSSGKKASAFFMLEQDVFNAISDWYFDAVLELSRIPNFRLEPKVIAKSIGITQTQAQIAMDTLIRLKLLVVDKNGRYKSELFNTSNILDPDSTTAAQRKYQSSVLEKSALAVMEVERKDRDHTSTVMAICKNDLSKAKVVIQKFRHQLNKLMQKNPNSFDSVYQLHVGFFPISKSVKEMK